MGWIKRGDLCFDPFAGICGFGFHAMCYGLNFIGIELEQKFVDLGQQNIDLWLRQLRGWPNLGTARVIQGDSRRLKDVIENKSLCECGHDKDEHIHFHREFKCIHEGCMCKDFYIRQASNLANLPEGNFQDVIRADLVVSESTIL